MNHRSGVTLVEVLVAIFVMGIGMLALLTLFPLGALSMAQALKDNRCADSGASAAAMAQALDVLGDYRDNMTPSTNRMVFVDPIGIATGYGTTVTGTTIPRRDLHSTRQGVTGYPYRFFSIQDDLEFNPDGTPIADSGTVRRLGRYSWAYFLRRDPNDETRVDLWVVVYYSRATGTASDEVAITTVSGAIGDTQLTLTASGTTPPNLRRGAWVLDSTNGDFYRVVSSTVAGNAATVEVDPPLKNTAGGTFVVMENAAEVFFRQALK